MQAKNGFTLVEMMVVVLLLAIIAAVAIPLYNRSVENSRADDALSMLQMIATTNRMYAVDYNRFTQGPIDNNCNSATCVGAASPSPPGCDLVACNLLAKQDFGHKYYSFQALAPIGVSASACGLSFPVSDLFVACARRNAGGPAFSSEWGYAVNRNGKVYASVPGCSDCLAPPEPVY